MRALFLLLASWLLANLVHALWIRVRMRRSEATVRRDAQGLREGARPYTVGSGPVAVLWVHGFADTPAVFRRMAERLAATGAFTCRAMRLPGAGEPVRQSAKVTLADWRGSIRRELRELQRSHAQVWMAGHSLGAGLALRTALDPDAGVAGVLALAPLLRVSRRRAPVLSAETWFRLAQGALLFSRTFESCFAVNVLAADDPAFVPTRDAFIPFATYRNLFALIRDLRPRAADLRLPVFVALAEDDRVVDNAAAVAWFDAVPTPRAVRTLPGAAHALPLECGWKSLTDDLAAFILGPRGHSSESGIPY